MGVFQAAPLNFASRRDYGASVVRDLVDACESRDVVEVTAFDEDGSRYEAPIYRDLRTGRLSIDTPTKS